MIGKKATCPWCGEKVPKDEYEAHLLEFHYRKEGDTLIGPYQKLPE